MWNCAEILWRSFLCTLRIRGSTVVIESDVIEDSLHGDALTLLTCNCCSLVLTEEKMGNVYLIPIVLPLEYNRDTIILLPDFHASKTGSTTATTALQLQLCLAFALGRECIRAVTGIH